MNGHAIRNPAKRVWEQRKKNGDQLLTLLTATHTHGNTLTPSEDLIECAIVPLVLPPTEFGDTDCIITFHPAPYIEKKGRNA
jgi:hypothetical protein